MQVCMHVHAHPPILPTLHAVIGLKLAAQVTQKHWLLKCKPFSAEIATVSSVKFFVIKRNPRSAKGFVIFTN